MPPENPQQRLWTAVDRYFSEKLALNDATLDATLAANAAADLPAIDVAPNQGKLLQLLSKLVGARKILEIGTLGGYSTIFLARALPTDGRVITLEFNAKHADVAYENIRRAGLLDRVEIRVGAALDNLRKIAAEGLAPFDLIFIDADKPNNPAYFEWAMKLSRVGTLILCDNVVREGKVIEADCADAAVQGARKFFDKLAAESRVSATALQTVGSKGHDGFAIAVVERI
jgi:predicted O-methyltransferase YrrM